MNLKYSKLGTFERKPRQYIGTKSLSSKHDWGFFGGRGVVLFECAKETELRSQFNITRDERLLEYACIAWEKSLKEEVEKLTFTMKFQHDMEGETVRFLIYHRSTISKVSTNTRTLNVGSCKSC